MAALLLAPNQPPPATAAALDAAGEPSQARFPGANTTTAALALSRDQALQLGRERSLRLQGSALTVAESRSLVELSRSRFRPRVDLVGFSSFAQVGTEIGFISNLPTIGDLSFDLRGNGSAVINNTFINAGVLVNLPLLDFARMPLRQEAEANLQAAAADLREQERQSRFEVLNHYLTAQWTAALIPAWERALATSLRLESDAQALRREGLAPRIDSLQAQALVQTDRQGLAEARAQHQIAVSGLARSLNLPAATSITVTDPLQPDAPWEQPLQQSIALALQRRPALESLQQQRQAQQARLQLAQAGRLPSLSLVLGAGVSGDWLEIDGQKNRGSIGGSGALPLPALNSSGSASGAFYDWGAALTLRQPLYDGGVTRQTIQLAQQRAQRVELAIAEAEQLIIQSVETWYATHQAAGPQADAARAAIIAGEQSVQDAQIRYRAGLAPFTEVLVAQRNLQVARSAEATAIYRGNLSRAGLERETGLGSDDAAATATPTPTPTPSPTATSAAAAASAATSPTTMGSPRPRGAALRATASATLPER